MAYIFRSMHSSSQLLLNQMIRIIEGYEQRGYKLTIRQLYYQLVSRNVVHNDMSSYQCTIKALQTGRMTGQVDWDTSGQG